MRQVVEKLVNHTAARILPAAVLAIAAFAGLWHLSRAEPARGTPLQLAVWAEPAGAESEAGPAEALEQLKASPARETFETHLSTRPFWFAVHAVAPVGATGHWLVEFPSRHAMDLRCWDSGTLQPLGAVNRDRPSQGAIQPMRAGFALSFDAARKQGDLVCRSDFRGPAKISATVWNATMLAAAQQGFQRIGLMLEVGLGVLALSIALTATINGSPLYWAFVGWLFVSLRMALLSEGLDASIFGIPLPAAVLTPMRQWTLCFYFVSTIAVFSMLFGKELLSVRGRWLLQVHKLASLAMLLLCCVLDYEQLLPVLWLGSAVLMAIWVPYLYVFLSRLRSRHGLWYASSIIVTLAATLNEVVAASLGQRLLMGGLNSVTAALASALLATAAVAEHMRADRREREQAQRTLKAAYDDSPIGLFTVH